MDVDLAKNEAIIVESITAAVPFFKFNNALKTWWKESADGIVELISYQRSRTQGQFFINIGLYFERLAPLKKKPPKFAEWHLWTRYERVMKIGNSDWNTLSSLREDISDRAKEVHDNIVNCVVPHLDEIAEYGYLAQHFGAEGDFHTFWLQNLRRVELVTHIREVAVPGNT